MNSWSPVDNATWGYLGRWYSVAEESILLYTFFYFVIYKFFYFISLEAGFESLNLTAFPVHYLCFVFVVGNRISQLPAPAACHHNGHDIYRSNGKVANTR